MTPPPTMAAGAVKVTWIAGVKPKRIAYIWKKRIARGKLTLVGGDPGVGKGTFGVDVTARVTTAARWPDGGEAPLCRVLLLTGEDDPADTIVPRLDVAGADRSRVGLLGRVITVDGQERRISLDTDIDPMMEQASADQVDVIIIDPLSSYLGANTNSWRDSDMRRILDALAEAAAKYGIAVIVVVHLTKSSGTNSMYRFQGSIATAAAVRFSMLIAPHPRENGLRVLASVKANLANKPPSLTFRIVPRIHPELEEDEIGCVEWVGHSPLTADELLVEPDRKSTAAQRAEDFLLEYLAAGEAPSEDVKEAGTKAGIGKNAVWEAKAKIGVLARKDGTGGWFWKLPYEAAADRDSSFVAEGSLELKDPNPSQSEQASQSDREPLGAFNSNEPLPHRYVDNTGTNGSIPKNPDVYAPARTREDGVLFDGDYLAAVGAEMDAEAVALGEESE